MGSFSSLESTIRAPARQVQHFTIIIANSVTIQPGAQFALNRIGNNKLTIGTVFHRDQYHDADSDQRTFASLANGSTVYCLIKQASGQLLRRRWE
jgi:hypothetical protein